MQDAPPAASNVGHNVATATQQAPTSRFTFGLNADSRRNAGGLALPRAPGPSLPFNTSLFSYTPAAPQSPAPPFRSPNVTPSLFQGFAGTSESQFDVRGNPRVVQQATPPPTQQAPSLFQGLASTSQNQYDEDGNPRVVQQAMPPPTQRQPDPTPPIEPSPPPAGPRKILKPISRLPKRSRPADLEPSFYPVTDVPGDSITPAAAQTPSEAFSRPLNRSENAFVKALGDRELAKSQKQNATESSPRPYNHDANPFQNAFEKRQMPTQSPATPAPAPNPTPSSSRETVPSRQFKSKPGKQNPFESMGQMSQVRNLSMLEAICAANRLFDQWSENTEEADIKPLQDDGSSELHDHYENIRWVTNWFIGAHDDELEPPSYSRDELSKLRDEAEHLTMQLSELTHPDSVMYDTYYPLFETTLAQVERLLDIVESSIVWQDSKPAKKDPAVRLAVVQNVPKAPVLPHKNDGNAFLKVPQGRAKLAGPQG